MWKIRDTSLMAPFILNLLLKTIRFYLFSRLRGNVSREPLFLLKTGKTWRHSDVICGRSIGGVEFFFFQDLRNWCFGGYWKFGDDPFVTFGDIVEKREGAKNRPPRSGVVTLKSEKVKNLPEVKIWPQVKVTWVHMLTQVGHAAYQAMRHDKTSTMRPCPCL